MWYFSPSVFLYLSLFFSLYRVYILALCFMDGQHLNTGEPLWHSQCPWMGGSWAWSHMLFTFDRACPHVHDLTLCCPHVLCNHCSNDQFYADWTSSTRCKLIVSHLVLQWMSLTSCPVFSLTLEFGRHCTCMTWKCGSILQQEDDVFCLPIISWADSWEIFYTDL